MEDSIEIYIGGSLHKEVRPLSFLEIAQSEIEPVCLDNPDKEILVVWRSNKGNIISQEVYHKQENI